MESLKKIIDEAKTPVAGKGKKPDYSQYPKVERGDSVMVDGKLGVVLKVKAEPYQFSDGVYEVRFATGGKVQIFSNQIADVYK